MDCCSRVELKSDNCEGPLKALGVYTLKQGSIIKNRPVYIEEQSGSHLLFGLDGWKVIPSTPEDNDPPLASFIHCKPPRESVCPDRCVNDGNWTFFSQAEGKDLPDTEKRLSLSCFNVDKGFNVAWIAPSLICLIILVLVAVIWRYHKKVIRRLRIVKTALTLNISNAQNSSFSKNVGATPVKHRLDIEKSESSKDNENRKVLIKEKIMNTKFEKAKDFADDLLETPTIGVTTKSRAVPSTV